MVTRTIRTVLVTGGAGFIGSEFVNMVLNATRDVRVVCLDALTYAGERRRLPDQGPRFRFVSGFIEHEGLVRNLVHAEQPDVIVHFAAESHVDRSVVTPMQFVWTNVYGTGVLLGAAMTLPTRPLFCYVSTDEVHGSLSPDDAPCTEEAPYRPSNPYSATKAAADHLVRAYHQTYGLPVIVTHGSNTYGPHQHPEKLIPMAITRALAGEPITIFGSGQQVRDWLYVSDHARALWSVITKGRDGQTYNIAGGDERTNLDVVHDVCAAVAVVKAQSVATYTRLVTHTADRPAHDQRYALDTTKVNRECGFSPIVPFSVGLLSTVQWHVERQAERQTA